MGCAIVCCARQSDSRVAPTAFRPLPTMAPPAASAIDGKLDSATRIALAAAASVAAVLLLLGVLLVRNRRRRRSRVSTSVAGTAGEFDETSNRHTIVPGQPSCASSCSSSSDAGIDSRPFRSDMSFVVRTSVQSTELADALAPVPLLRPTGTDRSIGDPWTSVGARTSYGTGSVGFLPP